MPESLYRVECICLKFSACTDDSTEAQKMRNLHRNKNSVIGFKGPYHNVRVTAMIDHKRRENTNLLPTLTEVSEGATPSSPNLGVAQETKKCP